MHLYNVTKIKKKKKKHHNLEVIGYYLSCFDPPPPHQNALSEWAWWIVDSEVNAHCYYWLVYI